MRLASRKRAFAYLPPAEQRHLLDSLSNEQVRHLLAQMSPDDRTHLLEEMPAEVTRELLLQLDPRELQAARQLLGYPENTAGRYMTPKYTWIYPGMTAAAGLGKIRQTGKGRKPSIGSTSSMPVASWWRMSVSRVWCSRPPSRTSWRSTIPSWSRCEPRTTVRVS